MKLEMTSWNWAQQSWNFFTVIDFNFVNKITWLKMSCDFDTCHCHGNYCIWRNFQGSQVCCRKLAMGSYYENKDEKIVRKWPNIQQFSLATSSLTSLKVFWGDFWWKLFSNIIGCHCNSSSTLFFFKFEIF